ncbi:glycosyltransferase family 2 protein [Alteribacillus iranensis]|uniref:Glycosyl transferase family 2 n=1 Tax=Alteribacillus iranensis TaxID=930128 RepID=A0A1I2BGI0_9BACI|nr:glycosyltransferase family 2 protein [Alteribacillus iranensis]SFE55271.1 Glycosyl transferase family 2 [Alteribacillus iranensis]
MEYLLVSVIITTYKRDKKVLKRAIDSVLNQTYTSFELIVVDDNGLNNEFQKGVEEVVNSVKTIKDIKLIKHEMNQGAQKARNTGIKNASGKYIAFLDDDDEWLDRKLELQIDKFRDTADDDLGLVYCWYYKYKQLEEDNYDEIFQKTTIKTERVKKELLYRNFIGSTSFPLIKKECFDNVGYFDENLEAKQDYDMWIRISKKYKIDYVAEPLCNYYDHFGERITNNIEKKIRAEKIFLEKHLEYIQNDKKALATRNKIIGMMYLKGNDYTNARKYIWNSAKLLPFNYKVHLLMLISILKHKPTFVKKYI